MKLPIYSPFVRRNCTPRTEHAETIEHTSRLISQRHESQNARCIPPPSGAPSSHEWASATERHVDSSGLIVTDFTPKLKRSILARLFSILASLLILLYIPLQNAHALSDNSWHSEQLHPPGGGLKKLPCFSHVDIINSHRTCSLPC